MQSSGEWGQFFPGRFAPNPYDESCSGFFFPLSQGEQERLGYRTAEALERKISLHLDVSEIPDFATDITNIAQIYWDTVAGRPFSITKEDVTSAIKLGLPSPDTYYMRRIQENFKFIPFHGKLRAGTCAKTGNAIMTGWPLEFDGRILSDEVYLEMYA